MSKYTDQEAEICTAIDDTDLTLVQARNCVNQGDPIEALARIASARASATAAERHTVALARMGGSTWEEIGYALGMSRQAAHEQFRAVDK